MFIFTFSPFNKDSTLIAILNFKNYQQKSADIAVLQQMRVMFSNISKLLKTNRFQVYFRKNV